jgi:drug/metabolite transporter (DMT)-like permease
MNSALLGLVAALAWGLNDFLARFPSRAVGPIPTVLAVTAAGLIVLSARLLLGGAVLNIVWPSLWLVAFSGVFFALGTLSLYAALARGPISIVAPIAGSFPALAMIFAVAQGTRPTLTQWLSIGAVMAGVAIVARSGGHYEASGELQPGKLKNVLGLAFLASFCFALSLASGARASFRAPRRPAKVWCRKPRHRRERRGPGHRRGCQGHCHGRQEDRQGRLVHRDAGLRLLGSQVCPAAASPSMAAGRIVAVAAWFEQRQY